MSAPPGDRGQLDFLRHVQRIFDEGEFVATYKFALLIALVELAIERGARTGSAGRRTTGSVFPIGNIVLDPAWLCRYIPDREYAG